MEGEEEKQDTRWPREGGIAWRHGLATLVARWPTRSQSVRHYHESPPLCDQGHFCESLDIEHGVENEMKRWWIFVVNSKRQSEAIKKKVRMLVFCDFFSICPHFLQILETLKLKNVSFSMQCAASILVCISIPLFWSLHFFYPQCHIASIAPEQKELYRFSAYCLLLQVSWRRNLSYPDAYQIFVVNDDLMIKES